MLKKSRQDVKRNSYSPGDVKKAAQVYAVTGNMVKASKMTGFQRTTLKYWKDNKPEWVQ
jgi:hypothetical protein